ncbi:hypothetical protein HYFRA_00005483 [Hymenoscyphus fraxineus]|uniref:Uncharacterized protein n=1 Tax=Hymenoscyphus fraxineus TaxID=746836 RepID=A0A9N9PQP7_9HELO|nr:hypothetical protein HYFRA_00005483 [Hymenoscyphus fraxineus]
MRYSILPLLSATLTISQITAVLAAPRSPANTKVTHQFSSLTRAENIAARPNGDLLVMALNAPEILLVDPTLPSQPDLPIARFPDARSTHGIAEIAPDVFAVGVGDYIVGVGTTFGNYSIWKVDMRPLRLTRDNATGGATIEQAAEISLIADVPESKLFNGMTHLGGDSPYVLVADSVLGAVFRVNTQTGDYKIVIQDALLNPVPGAPVQIGINGIHMRDSDLYFSQMFLDGGFLGKCPVHLSGPDAGSMSGNFTIIAKNGPNDDFAIRAETGDIYTTTHFTNEMQRVRLDGSFETIAGSPDDPLFANNTAAAWGRGETDKDVLYVSTVGGDGVEPSRDGARVVAVDFRRS